MIIKSILCPLSKSIAFINLNVHNKSLVAKLDKFANINVMTCVATLHNFTCAIKPLYKDLHTSYKVKLWKSVKNKPVCTSTAQSCWTEGKSQRNSSILLNSRQVSLSGHQNNYFGKRKVGCKTESIFPVREIWNRKVS